MKLETYIIVAIVFISILTATFSTQADIVKEYYEEGYTDVDLEVSQEGKLTGMTELNRIGKSIEDRMLKLSTKASTLDLTAIYDLAGLFVDVGTYLIQIPNVMLQTIELTFSALTGIAIPIWFKTAVLSIATLLIMIKLAAVFLKRENL